MRLYKNLALIDFFFKYVHRFQQDENNEINANCLTNDDCCQL